MPKGTILDRLAGAMKTLSKREGKSMTPRQRVSAAQRWNSLADIGEEELATLDRLSEYPGARGHEAMTQWNQMEEELEDLGFLNEHAQRADNPFLSDNIYKYEEQSDFLDWCRYNGLEPNGRNLKTFRWERYKGMSTPQRERIYDNYDPSFLPGERMW
jgi:hypothetical protein